jgi:chromosome segregation ATPase
LVKVVKQYQVITTEITSLKMSSSGAQSVSAAPDKPKKGKGTRNDKQSDSQNEGEWPFQSPVATTLHDLGDEKHRTVLSIYQSLENIPYEQLSKCLELDQIVVTIAAKVEEARQREATTKKLEKEIEKLEVEMAKLKEEIAKLVAEKDALKAQEKRNIRETAFCQGFALPIVTLLTLTATITFFIWDHL